MSDNKMSSRSSRRVKRKKAKIVIKTNQNKQDAEYIANQSAALRERLGNNSYEKLRTGKVKLSSSDAKIVSRINTASENIKRNKANIKRKQVKINKLNG